jgi:ribonuclease VapC
VIAVDTSALLAIFRSEDEADLFYEKIVHAPRAYISVASLFEASLVTLGQRGSGFIADLDLLVQNLGLIVQPVEAGHLTYARLASERFGKGRGHRAQLNFGDCLSYALAQSLGVPLLFKGKDFAETDVMVA